MGLTFFFTRYFWESFMQRSLINLDLFNSYVFYIEKKDSCGAFQNQVILDV